MGGGRLREVLTIGLLVGKFWVIRCLQSIQKTLLVLAKIFLAKNFNSES